MKENILKKELSTGIAKFRSSLLNEIAGLKKSTLKVEQKKLQGEC